MSSPYVQTINTNGVGESPHWDAEKQILLYTDLERNAINRFNPATGETNRCQFDGQLEVGFVVPVAGQDNNYVMGKGRDLNLVEWDGHSSSPTTMTTILSVEPDKPDNSFNDGKADSLGRLWAGTRNGRVSNAALYKISKGEITTMETGLNTGNGMAWNSDNTLMFYIDSGTGRVDVFDYDSVTGTISNRRPVYDFAATGERGGPDGMTIDANDNLIVGCWGGKQLIHVDSATGQKIRTIPMPTTNITSAAFGGPNMDILYVASARYGLSESVLLNEPAAGAIFQITNLGVRGQPGGGNPYIFQ